MSYSINHNILDPGLYVKHQGPPHELFDLWREQDPVHWNPPTPDYESPLLASTMEKGFYVLTRHQVNEVRGRAARSFVSCHGKHLKEYGNLKRFKV